MSTNQNNTINSRTCFKVLLFIISLLFCLPSQAQVNYVQNPSLESYTKCPDGSDRINYANYWSGIDSDGNMNCTPEYCNTCATDDNARVPNNYRFYHYPRNGNGMAQVMMFSDEFDTSILYKRDYLVGRFYKPLIGSRSYCVTFFVLYEQHSEYTIQNIGAVINSGITDTSKNCGHPKTAYSPQVVGGSIMSDTVNWMKIEGKFIATGDEKYITIGNFSDKAHTNYALNDPRGDTIHLSWYLVDDVCVIESDAPAYAGRDTTIAYGDSVFIGRDEILPDVRWYYNLNGHTAWALIDTMRAGFWVKPAKGTNKYAVTQTLCDGAKFDTVTINAWPLGVEQLTGQKSNWSIYPNPARGDINVVNIRHTANSNIRIYDVSGRPVFQEALKFDHFNAQVHFNLAPGVYVVRFNDGSVVEGIERLVVY